MNRTRTVLQTALLWAMLPLIAFSSSPRYVCLCSTGDLKLFCHGASSEPSCNAEAVAAPAFQSKPSPHRSCCQQKAASSVAVPSCAAVGCHCTPVVAMPDTPPKSEPASLPDVDLAANEIADDAFGNVLSLSHPAAGIEVLHSARGRDILTVLSRLVI